MKMKSALANVPAVDKGPWVVAFGNDRHSWNIHADDDDQDGEGSGLPGEGLIAAVLQTFGDCWGDYDAETAARIFNLPLGLIEPLTPINAFEADPADIEIHELGALVQALTATRSNWGSCSVAEVARLTNQHPTRIIEAVGASHWMFLFGDRDKLDELIIEHEGE